MFIWIYNQSANHRANHSFGYTYYCKSTIEEELWRLDNFISFWIHHPCYIVHICDHLQEWNGLMNWLASTLMDNRANRVESTPISGLLYRNVSYFVSGITRTLFINSHANFMAQSQNIHSSFKLKLNSKHLYKLFITLYYSLSFLKLVQWMCQC